MTRTKNLYRQPEKKFAKNRRLGRFFGYWMYWWSFLCMSLIVRYCLLFCTIKLKIKYMYMLMHVTARYFLFANYLNKLQLLENIFENVVSQNISNFDNGTYFVRLSCKGWPAIGRPIFSQWRVGVLWRFYNDFIRSLSNRRILT